MAEKHGTTSQADNSGHATTSLFEPTPNPRVSAFEIIIFCLSAVFVFGGFYVMSLAFTFHDWGFELFGGGLLLDAFGLWIAFGLLPSLARNKEH